MHLRCAILVVGSTLAASTAWAAPARSPDPIKWEIEAMTMSHKHVVMGTFTQLAKRFRDLGGHDCTNAKLPLKPDVESLPAYKVTCWVAGAGTEYDFVLRPDPDSKMLGMVEVRANDVDMSPNDRDTLLMKIKRRID